MNGKDSNDASDVGTVLEGVRLVLRQFTHAFERTEVTLVEAEGRPFDPNLHEAIGQQESELPPGTVVSVLQRGYRLGDKLLRPALVVVAVAKAAPAAVAAERGPSPEAATAADLPVGDGGTPEGGG
jgi:molecular chaperone GrpE